MVVNPVTKSPKDGELCVVFDARTGKTAYCVYLAQSARFADAKYDYQPTHWVSAPSRSMYLHGQSQLAIEDSSDD